ncbi:EAL domain-containing protein [Methylotetracoccus oryzae]|uniref:EAL domain-containing protein n=1 Tax=Methylotetracoccus oryzae TaxID=1919059 RepID=UPI001118536A|nr:EAL domain-containing protein [Methylotetracoccus oryzae]
MAERQASSILTQFLPGVAGNAAVILRTAGRDATDATCALQNEFEIVSTFRLECMLPLQAREEDGSQVALRYSDPGSRPPDVGATDTLTDVLRLAQALAEALAEVHASGLILCNLAPRNLRLSDGKIRIIDFSRALRVTQEHRDIGSPWLIPGDLRYVAPEQTGRMNRPLDYRCDYYAFGVCLYEWLTGCPPFMAADPTELIYAHLALVPTPPEQIDPRIPRFVSSLVTKLLAKDPEHRYQSIEGLRADLRIATELVTAGSATDLAVGTYDVSFRFRTSHKLFGREAERQLLLSCYEKACRGSREIVLIAGYSGVGKTALIRETYVPVTRQKALFVAGKFDQRERVLPYAAWLEALGKLLGFILAEPEDSLDEWRQRLAEALGANARLMTDLLPSLAMLIGTPPPVSELPPMEALNRFNQTFRDFIRACCRPKRPLVVFLDDLQWMDSASLNLFTLLSTDADCRNLLLIGAYRENEVPPTHPLSQAVQRIKQGADLQLTELFLEPLRRDAIALLLSDALAQSLAPDEPLVGLLQRKTGGNPFFLWQFLRILHGDGLITFDLALMRWIWAMDAIEGVAYADNVVDLMIRRLDALPERTRSLLAWGACLGASFDVERVARLGQCTVVEAYDGLSPAVGEELIVPAVAARIVSSRLIVREFRFLHDRVQEAALQLLSPEARPGTHCQIARQMLDELSAAEIDARIFDIADHLNRALPLLDTAAQRLDLARLNLLAARKAKACAAYGAARRYLEVGMSPAGEAVWDWSPGLAFDLYRERGELESLNGHFDEARAFLECAIAREPDPLRKASLFHLLVTQYTVRALYPQAIETARTGLALLNVTLPAADYAVTRNAELTRIRALLGDRRLAALGSLPVMEDPRQRAVMLLLTSMGPPCYRSHPDLWGVIVAMEIRLCLEYGTTASASYSYPAFGGLLTHVGQGGAAECAELLTATEQLLKRFDSPGDVSVGYLMMGSSLRHWCAPLVQASNDYLEAYNTGLSSGNLQYAAYGFGHNAYSRFYQGVSLPELRAEIETYLAFCADRKNRWGVDLIEGLLRICHGLCVPFDSEAVPVAFDWRGTAEADYLARCEQNGNLQVLCIYHILKAEAFCHLQLPEPAAASLIEAERRIDSVSTQGLLPAAQFRLLRALLLVWVPESLGVSPGQARREIAELCLQCRAWAEGAPDTYAYAAEWLEGEAARLDGQWPAALDAYDRAIDAARTQRWQPRVGLIAMRASELWASRNRSPVADFYRDQARIAYRGWQADAVLAQSFLAASSPSPGDVGTGLRFLAECDLRNAARVAQMISNHTMVDEVVAAAVANLGRMTGAQRVVMFLATDSGLRLALDTTAASPAPADLPLEQLEDIPQSLINYVQNTLQTVRISAQDDSPFADDRYLQGAGVLSAMVVPLSNLGQLMALVYLEHREVAGAFPLETVPLLELIAAQAAVSLTNARLYESLRREIWERERLQEHERRLEKLAHHDALTGLPNRILFADRLRQAMAQARRNKRRVAVAYIDLDGFKAVNDRHGHAVGDQLLAALSQYMAGTLRESDTFARIGGDEFAVVLAGSEPAGSIEPVLSRLLVTAAQPVPVGGVMLSVSASIGVTFYPQDEEIDADQLLRQADQAMYQAKLTGKNRCHFFDAAHDRDVKGQHALIGRLRRALDDRAFVLHYQPKVDMRRGETVAAEALLRWQCPEEGLLYPGKFLPAIEDHPLMVELGEWVIDAALSQLERWRAEGVDLTVSVNISAQQLQQSDFVERLNALLQAHPAVAPEKLVLEVVETAALQDVMHVARIMRTCRDIGVRFALDDFGTGYSSLMYLKNLPAALLKIDQSFVRDMLSDVDDLAIIDGILGLVSAFRREVIAEGVETLEQGELLLQMGCEKAQGYAIARPMPANELPLWLRTWQPVPAWRDANPVGRELKPLLFAAVEHRAWVQGVADCIRDGEAQCAPLPERGCHLWQWLSSPEAGPFRSHAGFGELARIHSALHAVGNNLLSRRSPARAEVRLAELNALHDGFAGRISALLRETV